MLQAGPCPVTAIRTPERDGYDAVQLAFGQAKEKHLTKAEIGHLRKADAPPLRHVVEFRDAAGELQVGESVTVESFEVGARVKVSGVSKGKGFRARSSDTTSPAAQVARLAQQARAGLDRGIGDPLARAQGHPRTGPDGQQARDPAGPGDRLDRHQGESAARCGSVPGPRGGVVEVRSNA